MFTNSDVATKVIYLLSGCTVTILVIHVARLHVITLYVLGELMLHVVLLPMQYQSWFSILRVSCVHRLRSKLTVPWFQEFHAWFYLFQGSYILLGKLQGKQRNSVTIKENLLNIVPHTDQWSTVYLLYFRNHGITCISYKVLLLRFEIYMCIAIDHYK